MTNELIEVPRGLSNVAVTETAISDVNGDEGFYQYRDHSAIELARGASFEAVWHLLVFGHLPSGEELEQFQARVRQAQSTPELAATVARVRISEAEPLKALQSALPLLGSARGMRPVFDLDEDARVAESIELAAAAPIILAAAYRGAKGLAPLQQLDERGVVANYLRQVTGSVPTAEDERALTTYLVAAMDHGFNASTFTCRVIASTGADVASCLTGALGALSGPLHGGAPARALDSLDAAGSDVEAWILSELRAGRRLMGFGHPVYRTTDPRSALLKQVAESFGGPRVAEAMCFEETADRLLAEHKPNRSLRANVEFYAAIVMEHCGIPREMFTPTFAAARVIGWTAHALEQARDSKIFRPSAKFLGKRPVGVAVG
ncbi:citrate/2-methylcitrate synthase [uncultured Agrococcus sp.]|uniref:citrate/2-methylcitrate synthase n=1 Tax=uncultured Agrococcus sp. TaxID=382258 RepID=UPI0025FCAA3F|nr:citrate/2-methylcitrate synthase [uncultured Agrococcus sp.]